MADDWLLRLLRRFGTPSLPPSRTVDLREIDERLGMIEQNQAQIRARLRLLEMQANPRDLGGERD